MSNLWLQKIMKLTALLIKKALTNLKKLKKNSISILVKKSSTLNEEIEKLGIPTYIKIDCEGAEEKILKNLKYRIKTISFELNLPTFFTEGCKIINYFYKNFNSKFNIRIHNNFYFEFKKNVNHLKCLNFLKNKNLTVEVFIFN